MKPIANAGLGDFCLHNIDSKNLQTKGDLLVVFSLLVCAPSNINIV